MSGNLENINPETDALTGMFKKHDEALAAIERVREIHRPNVASNIVWRFESENDCSVCDETYPCPTIRALDSGQDD